jgi:hypothetical protein
VSAFVLLRFFKMNFRSIAALALLAVFSLPIAAGAVATTSTAAPHSKKGVHPKHTVNSKDPGSPGFTGSSPLGSAQKKKKAPTATHT